MARIKRTSDPASVHELQSLLHEGLLSLRAGAKVIRALSGDSQRDFARRAGVNKKVIHDLESGSGNVGLASLERIAAAAGLRLAFVAAPAVDLLSPDERNASKQDSRHQDSADLRGGLAAAELHARNALPLGGVRLALPRIVP